MGGCKSCKSTKKHAKTEDSKKRGKSHHSFLFGRSRRYKENAERAADIKQLTNRVMLSQPVIIRPPPRNAAELPYFDRKRANRPLPPRLDPSPPPPPSRPTPLHVSARAARLEDRNDKKEAAPPTAMSSDRRGRSKEVKKKPEKEKEKEKEMKLSADVKQKIVEKNDKEDKEKEKKVANKVKMLDFVEYVHESDKDSPIFPKQPFHPSVHYPEGHKVVILTEFAKVKRTIRQKMYQSMKEDEKIFVCWTGHGGQINGEIYLEMHRWPCESDECVSAEFIKDGKKKKTKRNLIPLSMLVDFLRDNLQCEIFLVLLICRDGGDEDKARIHVGKRDTRVPLASLTNKLWSRQKMVTALVVPEGGKLQQEIRRYGDSRRSQAIECIHKHNGDFEAAAFELADLSDERDYWELYLGSSGDHNETVSISHQMPLPKMNKKELTALKLSKMNKSRETGIEETRDTVEFEGRSRQIRLLDHKELLQVCKIYRIMVRRKIGFPDAETEEKFTEYLKGILRKCLESRRNSQQTLQRRKTVFAEAARQRVEAEEDTCMDDTSTDYESEGEDSEPWDKED